MKECEYCKIITEEDDHQCQYSQFVSLSKNLKLISRPCLFHKSPNNWSCGYQNFLTITSEFPKLPKNTRQIQYSLHEAWKAGFDEQGAQDFNYQVIDSRKWIGTTEVSTILNYYCIKNVIYDFHKQDNVLLVEFLQKHFTTKQYPLYLQYQGHSKTVVGIDDKYVYYFDPGRNGWSRETFDKLNRKQYSCLQIIGEMTKEESLEYKILRSVRIP
ncbi:hypothetical protein HDV01_006900 [Terramyces sp. JEL0728]|nr:hypothetical protein HDV01_006900 [Terramyces sp. JEL0728]